MYIGPVEEKNKEKEEVQKMGKDKTEKKGDKNAKATPKAPTAEKTLYFVKIPIINPCTRSLLKLMQLRF